MTWLLPLGRLRLEWWQWGIFGFLGNGWGHAQAAGGVVAAAAPADPCSRQPHRSRGARHSRGYSSHSRSIDITSSSNSNSTRQLEQLRQLGPSRCLTRLRRQQRVGMTRLLRLGRWRLGWWQWGIFGFLGERWGYAQACGVVAAAAPATPGLDSAFEVEEPAIAAASAAIPAAGSGSSSGSWIRVAV